MPEKLKTIAQLKQRLQTLAHEATTFGNLCNRASYKSNFDSMSMGKQAEIADELAKANHFFTRLMNVDLIQFVQQGRYQPALSSLETLESLLANAIDEVGYADLEEQVQILSENEQSYYDLNESLNAVILPVRERITVLDNELQKHMACVMANLEVDPQAIAPEFAKQKNHHGSGELKKRSRMPSLGLGMKKEPLSLAELAPYLLFIDRNSGLITDHLNIMKTINETPVSMKETEALIIDGLKQMHQALELEIKAVKEQLENEINHLDRYKNISKQLGVMPSNALSKIPDNIMILKAALDEQKNQRAQLNRIDEQYSHEKVMWQNADLIAAYPKEMAKALSQRSDKRMVKSILSCLSDNEMQQAVTRLNYEDLNLVAVNGFLEYIKGAPNSPLGKVKDKLSFVQLALEVNKTKELDRYKIPVNTVKDKQVVKIGLALKEQHLAHDYLTPKLLASRPKLNQINFLIEHSAVSTDLSGFMRNKVKERSDSLEYLMEMTAQGVLTDSKLIEQFITDIASGSEEQQTKVQQKLQAIISVYMLDFNSDQKNAYMKEINENNKLANAVNDLFEQTSDTTRESFNPLFLMLLKDAESSEKEMIHRLCDDIHGEHYKNALVLLCQHAPKGMGCEFFEKLNKVPLVKMKEASIMLMALNTAFDQAYEEATCLGDAASEEKFKKQLEDVKQYAFDITLNNDKTLYEKGKLIKDKVETTLEPSWQKRVWRKVKDAFLAVVSALRNQQAPQTFWHKTESQAKAAEEIKKALTSANADETADADKENSLSNTMS